jgi:hypothetical protein
MTNRPLPSLILAALLLAFAVSSRSAPGEEPAAPEPAPAPAPVLVAASPNRVSVFRDGESDVATMRWYDQFDNDSWDRNFFGRNGVPFLNNPSSTRARHLLVPIEGSVAVYDLREHRVATYLEIEGLEGAATSESESVALLRVGDWLEAWVYDEDAGALALHRRIMEIPDRASVVDAAMLGDAEQFALLMGEGLAEVGFTLVFAAGPPDGEASEAQLAGVMQLRRYPMSRPFRGVDFLSGRIALLHGSGQGYGSFTAFDVDTGKSRGSPFAGLILGTDPEGGRAALFHDLDGAKNDTISIVKEVEGEIVVEATLRPKPILKKSRTRANGLERVACFAPDESAIYMLAKRVIDLTPASMLTGGIVPLPLSCVPLKVNYSDVTVEALGGEHDLNPDRAFLQRMMVARWLGPPR